jgi:hypothetical protein
MNNENENILGGSSNADPRPHSRHSFEVGQARVCVTVVDKVVGKGCEFEGKGDWRGVQVATTATGLA